MPGIYVVIVAYRSDATLARCLKALEAQTFRDFEVILVDNGLTPSLDALARNSSLTLRVLALGHNLGFAAGNNLAVKNVSPDAQWFVMLNPDAYARPDWLENFVRAQKKYPDTAMFGSLQLDAAHEDICDGRGDCYHIFGVAWRRGHGHPLPKKLHDRETFSPCAAASFYRADVFRHLGGFDEDYFCYFEDVDLGFRIQLVYGHCIQLAGVVVAHVGGASGTSDFAIFHALRNMVWTYVKNMPMPALIFFAPGMIASALALAVRYTLSGNGSAAWHALYKACAHIGIVWKKRKIIQSQRRISIGTLLRAMTWLPLQPFSHLLRPQGRKYFKQ